MQHNFNLTCDILSKKERFTSPRKAELILIKRKELLSLLSTIPYESLIKEFDNNTDKIKLFLSFINRDYKEIKNHLINQQQLITIV